MKWINKLLDVPKLIRRLWVILWIVEILLIVMKFCFNIWYPIIIENEKIVVICDFIDSSPILSSSIMLLFYLLNENIQYLTSTQRIKYSKKKYLIIFNIIFIVNFIIKSYSIDIGGIIEIVYLVIIPIIYNIKYGTFKKLYKNIILPPIIYILITLWQGNIMFIRGIQDILSNLPFGISLCLQLDYYIFLIITWIGVKYFMGLWGTGWLWSDKLTKYEAKKEAELKKAEPDMEYVEYLDEKIAECKKHIEKKEEE